MFPSNILSPPAHRCPLQFRQPNDAPFPSCVNVSWSVLRPDRRPPSGSCFLVPHNTSSFLIVTYRPDLETQKKLQMYTLYFYSLNKVLSLLANLSFFPTEQSGDTKHQTSISFIECC